jgi:type I restriction enzyme R subunit
VKAGAFSERMTNVMNGYLNGQITNEQVIKELLDMAREMIEGDRSSEMSQEELAFYEAISRPEAIKDFYEHDVLVAMTKELTDQLRRNRTVDWQFRDDARAHMRMLVIRLLKKYKYPPEGMLSATETVLKQCEIWADNPDFDEPPAEKPFRYSDLYPEDQEPLMAAEGPPPKPYGS